jgi:hypothetical protein
VKNEATGRPALQWLRCFCGSVHALTLQRLGGDICLGPRPPEQKTERHPVEATQETDGPPREESRSPRSWFRPNGMEEGDGPVEPVHAV